MIRDLKTHTEATKAQEKRAEGWLARARTQDSIKALAKLTTEVDGVPRIISDPPLIVPVDELFPDLQAHELNDGMRTLLAQSAQSTAGERLRRTVDRHRPARVSGPVADLP